MKYDYFLFVFNFFSKVIPTWITCAFTFFLIGDRYLPLLPVTSSLIDNPAARTSLSEILWEIVFFKA
ncbi:Putative protein [Zobellia galactanivorans]|uniref:Uncharacterized protein n=1 Tax=Zobellia galactanivorans (strain DSM 12802 / CCUG 47099 / CIP 106680 / NCIMB 13871 / Dsij) TaxID=63186 RepID=G0L2D4_ZOBGA|nr:Putative protein [Zobellia galactanivorans]